MTVPGTGALSACEAAGGVRSGKIRARDLAEACAARVAELDGRLRAWAHFDPASCRRQADAVDALRAGGREPGRLAGLPVGVKDIFNTQDMATSMGSPLRQGYMAGNDARVVYYLRQAGAVIPGKTVTAEFAVHDPGPTLHPIDPSRSPGTSSSGSAVAVATGMVPLALGSQTAGSIIRPASYCGVLGFKPSFGLIPRTGMLKTTDTLDTVGFFSRSAEDMGLIFDACRVRGTNFPISHSILEDPGEQAPSGPWRLAFARTHTWSHAREHVRGGVSALAQRLAGDPRIRIEEARLPAELERSHEIHALIYDKALSYYFQEEHQESPERLSPVLREMLERGRAITLDRYRRALEEQASLSRVLDRFFERYDAVLCHSTADEAPPREVLIEAPDPSLMWTLCGAPSISLPLLASPAGLPLGAQFAARKYRDYKLLRLAAHIEASIPLPGPAEASRPGARSGSRGMA